jgi:hypothetical protein
MPTLIPKGQARVCFVTRPTPVAASVNLAVIGLDTGGPNALVIEDEPVDAAGDSRRLRVDTSSPRVAAAHAGRSVNQLATGNWQLATGN